jgi:hypothetical protein
MNGFVMHAESGMTNRESRVGRVAILAGSDGMQGSTKVTGVENRLCAKIRAEHQNRLVRKVVPNPNVMLKTFYKGFI